MMNKKKFMWNKKKHKNLEDFTILFKQKICLTPFILLQRHKDFQKPLLLHKSQTQNSKFQMLFQKENLIESHHTNI